MPPDAIQSSSDPAPIRIGVDTDILYSGMTGVGNYCFHLLNALMRERDDLRYCGFSGFGWRPLETHHLDQIAQLQDKRASDHQTAAAHSSRRLWRAKHALRARLSRVETARALYQYIRTKRFTARGPDVPLDLFHAFKYLPLSDPGVPTLPVVYDLSFVRHPETHPRQRLRYLERLPDLVARAPFIHTISQFSKNEIADVYRCSPDKIIVAPPAAGAIFRPLGDDITRADLAPFKLGLHGYLLAVGTLEPRKNLKTLIAAYARLSPAVRARAPLVVVGNTGWGDLDLPPQTQALKSDGTLRLLGMVSDIQLRSLYEGAVALLFPSIYEGFGMPAVEALACGTQVAHSAGTSMDEITDGIDALRISAMDADGWVEILTQLIDDPSRITQDRDERMARAAIFNWESSAAIVRQTYTKLVR